MADKLVTNAEARARLMHQKFAGDMRMMNPYQVAEWEADTWVVGGSRRSSGRRFERISFTRHAYVAPGARGLGAPFEGEFADFVRAIIVWRALNARKRPTGLAQMVLVRAMRYLYEELQKSETASASTRVSHIQPVHFDNAVQALRAREKPDTRYRVANYLEYVGEQIDRLGLTPAALRWKHSEPRGEGSGGLKSSRVGKQFLERRAKKLPSDEILYAVAEVSCRDDLSLPDLVRQRVIDLLFCGGFRINECLTLHRDALILEPLVDDLGNMVQGASGGEQPVRVGLRYLPEKDEDGVPKIKWIPSELAPIARRAFGDLLNITEVFAEAARFTFQNPGRALLGEPWDSMNRTSMLGTAEVREMVGLATPSSASVWIRSNVLNYVTDGRMLRCSKGSVETAICSLSEERGVQVNGRTVPIHQFLMVVPINFFHSLKATIRGTACLVTDQNISDFLCGRGKEGGRSPSVFERLGVSTSDGGRVRITTHQFRHFLDTVAATGGVSELVRARWMGRRVLSQNSAYDHESGLSLAKKVRDRLVEGGVIGPLGEHVLRLADPVRRAEVAEELVRAVHKTQLGRCFHDWAAMPCPEHEACWGCDEHLVVKGEPVALEEARRQLAEAKQAISVADSESADGTYGANNWKMAHRRKIYSLERVVAIHLDPNVPDGEMVQLGRGEL